MGCPVQKRVHEGASLRRLASALQIVLTTSVERRWRPRLSGVLFGFDKAVRDKTSYGLAILRPAVAGVDQTIAG